VPAVAFVNLELERLLDEMVFSLGAFFTFFTGGSGAFSSSAAGASSSACPFVSSEWPFSACPFVGAASSASPLTAGVSSAAGASFTAATGVSSTAAAAGVSVTSAIVLIKVGSFNH